MGSRRGSRAPLRSALQTNRLPDDVHKDPEGRPTVYDLIANVGTFLSPVGRLDLDTSGLLLMTNDNRFAERVTNPDSHVPKTYLVRRRRRGSPTCSSSNSVTASSSPTGQRGLPSKRARFGEIHALRDHAHRRAQPYPPDGEARRKSPEAGSCEGRPIGIGTPPIGKWRLLTPGEVAAFK